MADRCHEIKLILRRDLMATCDCALSSLAVQVTRQPRLLFQMAAIMAYCVLLGEQALEMIAINLIRPTEVRVQCLTALRAHRGTVLKKDLIDFLL